uniref:phosphoinositide phospholipase C n=1 Tax=Coturnix japonica TaxID=93934 RepID=A0A8C2TV33_COTJA
MTSHGRHIAEQLMTPYCTVMRAPDGSFLVRESETFVGDYVLSFWCNGEVRHCRIQWWQDASSHRYFLINNRIFDSLYDLISYYRETPLREMGANIDLHLTQEWFHGRMGAGRSGRHIAEQLMTPYCTVMRAPDGSFLVRESGTFIGVYVLSIWSNGKVQHCRIHSRQDAGSPKFFLTDNLVFDSLYDLISCYRETPLRYNNTEMRLTEPVPRSNACNKDWVLRDGTGCTSAAGVPLMGHTYGSVFTVMGLGSHLWGWRCSYGSEAPLMGLGSH